MKVKKVVVWAIDGGTYKVLDRLVERGIMPNLASLFKKGTRANLLSTLPPITGPAWVSFATGKNPGKHGCFNFFLPTKTFNDLKIISSEDIAGDTFYEILERTGKKCILVNLPVSWPPRLKRGVVIGSFLTTRDDFFFPSKLTEELPELASYQVFPDFFSEYGSRGEDLVQELRKIEKIRFKVAKRLFKKDWDFFFFLFSSTDWLQHQYLKELLSPKLKKNSYLISLFKDLDRYLGWFVENLPEKTALIVISDHGFKLYSGRFYPNKWLEENSYLKVKKSFEEKGKPQELVIKKIEASQRREIIFVILRKLALIVRRTPWLYQFLGLLVRWFNRLSSGKLEGGLSDPGDIGLKIDYQKTKACSPLGNFSQIYLNRKNRFQGGVLGEKEAKEIKKDLIKKLRKLRDPATGKRAVRTVYAKEKIFSGSLMERTPEIILESGDFWIKPSLSAQKAFLHGELACHDREGIFAFLIPGVKKKGFGQVTLYDLAPTILNLMGIEIPKEMDGKVIL